MSQKIKITESQLRTIIHNSVLNELNSKFAKKHTYKESTDRTEYLYKKIFENVKRVLMEDDTDRYGQKKNTDKKRREVMSWLKDPKTNLAEVGRELWGIKQGSDEDDAKRSLFSKKLHHKLNDDGYPYDFTDDEVNTLYGILQKGR